MMIKEYDDTKSAKLLQRRFRASATFIHTLLNWFNYYRTLIHVREARHPVTAN